MISDEIEKYVKEWVKEKKGEFDYLKAVETLQDKPKELSGLGIDDAIHFDFGIQDIVIRLDDIDYIQKDIINKNSINLILGLVNKYHYYLNIKQEFSKQNDDVVNIEKLTEIIKLFDDDFIDFLDKYLHLDRIITPSKSLKITDGHIGAMKYYLKSDFIYSLKYLQKYFKNKKSEKKLSIESKDIIGSSILKPKIAYIEELSQRLILKSLLFELLLFSSLRLKVSFTKKTSLYIIDFFFNKEWEARFKNKESEELAEPSLLLSKKIEQSLGKKTIECIQTHKLDIYDEVKKYYHSDMPTKDIPKHIKALMELHQIKSLLEKKFQPLFTSHDQI